MEQYFLLNITFFSISLCAGTDADAVIFREWHRGLVVDDESHSDRVRQRLQVLKLFQLHFIYNLQQGVCRDCLYDVVSRGRKRRPPRSVDRRTPHDVPAPTTEMASP